MMTIFDMIAFCVSVAVIASLILAGIGVLCILGHHIYWKAKYNMWTVWNPPPLPDEGTFDSGYVCTGSNTYNPLIGLGSSVPQSPFFTAGGPYAQLPQMYPSTGSIVGPLGTQVANQFPGFAEEEEENVPIMVQRMRLRKEIATSCRGYDLTEDEIDGVFSKLLHYGKLGMQKWQLRSLVMYMIDEVHHSKKVDWKEAYLEYYGDQPQNHH